MRIIGLDVHRSFAEVAILENGKLRSGGRIVLQHEPVVAFARTLRADDEVVLEATGNSAILVRLICIRLDQIRQAAMAGVSSPSVDIEYQSEETTR